MQASDIRAGLRDALPVGAGILPFGLVVGFAAVETGFSTVQAIAASLFVFAGAAQLALVDLLGRDAPLAVVVLTAVVLNLRLVMYSASIAPYFRRFSLPWKLGLSYLLTDQAYALSVARFEETPGTDRRSYYLGTAVYVWVVWMVGTVAGAVGGASIPPAWELEFAAPLVFVALLVPAVRTRPSLVAATVAGVVALLAASAPLQLGLLVGAVAGVAAGLVAERTLPSADGRPTPEETSGGTGRSADDSGPRPGGDGSEPARGSDGPGQEGRE